MSTRLGRFCSHARGRASTFCSHARGRASTWLGVGFAIALAIGARSAHASLVEALDLAALVAESEQVVVGRVVSETSRYDERGQIVTDTALQVEETLKGDRAPGAAIVVRRLGGVVDDIGMRVAGEASFSVGESVVLFGARFRAGGALRTVGMAQGAIRVVEKNGERWAQSSGVAAVRRDARGRLKSAPLAVPAPRRLEDLLGEIRTLVGATR
jgi:hypothetical protein